MKRWLTLFVAFSLSTASGDCADAFANGVKLFGAKQYTAASASFAQAVKANPGNDQAYYYQALSAQYSKDFVTAKRVYGEILRRFPGSQAAGYAAQALGLAPASSSPARSYARTGSAGASGSHAAGLSAMEAAGVARNPALDRFPDDCYVYYQNEGELLVIDAYMNSKPIKVIFDTGAESVSLGKNHLAEIGARAPGGAPVGYAVGVGDGGRQDVWDSAVDIRVGAIERRAFPISVQEHMGVHPLLGQEFFRDFTYTVDNTAKSIHFVKKSRSGGSIYDTGNSANDVPFTTQGREMVVDVQVNGRMTKMYFDTGAEGITLTKQQCKQLGITIPEDAEVGMTQGIAGSTRSVRFAVNRMKMGPIDLSSPTVSVDDSEAAGMGLLGQGFLHGWEYTIDYKKSVIRFRRR
jgi:predicted aspartyl protease